MTTRSRSLSEIEPALGKTDYRSQSSHGRDLLLSYGWRMLDLARWRDEPNAPLSGSVGNYVQTVKEE